MITAVLRHVCTRRCVVLGVVVGASRLPRRRSALLPLSEGPALFVLGGRWAESWLVGSLPSPMAIAADGVRPAVRVMRCLVRLRTFGEELTCFSGLFFCYVVAGVGVSHGSQGGWRVAMR